MTEPLFLHGGVADRLQLRAARSLEADFPGVTAWFGLSTGNWWALVPTSGPKRLVEALDPRELRAAIERPEGWPWPADL